MATLISSSVVNVNVQSSNKTVVLPLARTVQGQTFWIRDSTGTAGNPNTITVLTSGGDTLDRIFISATLNQRYQCIRVIAQSQTNYAVLQNSTLGGTWLP